jgi:hypothetical protein
MAMIGLARAAWRLGWFVGRVEATIRLLADEPPHPEPEQSAEPGDH